MEQAGCRILFPLTTMAVMGIVQVLPLLLKFWSVGQMARRYLREQRPDAVVLVDFPGFNWWIAYFARKEGIPVYYYLPPQLWAWGPWRVQRVHKYVDHVLSGLEFETEWYRQQGIQAHYVGHPFMEEVADRPVDAETISQLRRETPQIIGLLPGSRKMEVQLNWPVMLQVVAELNRRHPGCRFLVANYKPEHRNFCEQALCEAGLHLPIEFHVGKTSEIIAAADCCLMVSGSVSLELLARKTPAVVMYKAGRVMGTMARWLVTCQFMTLPNLIAGRALFPEFPFINRDHQHARAIAGILDRWLSQPEELQRVQQEVSAMADNMTDSQASRKTAEFLLQTLATSQQSGTNSPAGRRAA